MKYNSKATVEAILSASSKLFLEKGFEKTSMQDIADSAQISKGAIYHHFKSKDEIITMVMDKHQENVRTAMEKLKSETSSIGGKEQLSILLEKNIENQEIHNMDELMQTKIKSAEFVLSYMKSCVNNDSALISPLIKEGAEDKSISEQYPDECAEIFLLLLNVWCDPSVFLCDEKKLLSRLKFLQSLMKSIGMDILSDSFIERFFKLLSNLYFKNI